MTDREVVREKWPEAFCARLYNYIQGYGIRTGLYSEILGSGFTQDAAWADAARRIKENEND